MTIVELLVTFIMFSYCLVFVSSETSDVETFLTSIAEYTLAEDGKLNFTQLASKYGYPSEQYNVTTEDGYILTVFHIPGTRPPVLLFHGIAASADGFIIRGNISLAITLARAGYDVWVGNGRGNKYSRSHVSLNPDTDKQFWNYSFHEIGYYDLAATIDFVREKTGKNSISTISHSQGTTAHYVLASLRSEYNDRIKVSIQLAPIAFLDNLRPPQSIAILAGPSVSTAIGALGVEELFRDRGATAEFIKFICSKGIASYAVCAVGVFFPLFGFDPSSITPDFLNVAVGHFPAGTSRKSIQHFNQLALRKKFSQFDYGAAQNTIKYGSLSPPDYDLSAVNIKIALIYGLNDNLSREKDVAHLRDSLKNVIRYEAMEPKEWNHLDFVWGIGMPQYLYPSVFKVLDDYN